MTSYLTWNSVLSDGRFYIACIFLKNIISCSCWKRINVYYAVAVIAITAFFIIFNTHVGVGNDGVL